MTIVMSIDDQNMASAMLGQALLGVISPNFRRIAISFSEDVWKLGFWLESDDETDREEIEDVLGEFSGLVLGMENQPSKLEELTRVSSAPLPSLDPQIWRIVYLRRE